MIENKTFQRDLYYSQTELQKKYKMSVKRIQSLIEDNKIPIVTGTLFVTGNETGKWKIEPKYILKTDWHQIVK